MNLIQYNQPIWQPLHEKPIEALNSLDESILKSIQPKHQKDLKKTVKKLQRKEICHILGDLGQIQNKDFFKCQLTLAQTAVMAYKCQYCQLLIQKLPNMTTEQLRLIIMLAPKHQMQSIFSKLYPHQLITIAPYLSPPDMEDLLEVVSTSTILAMFGMLNPKQAKSLLEQMEYPLFMSAIPILPPQLLPYCLSNTSLTHRSKWLNHLETLPLDVLTVQFSKLPPSHLYLALSGGSAPDRVLKSLTYATDEQLMNVIPLLSKEWILTIAHYITNHQHQMIIHSLSETQKIQLSTYFQGHYHAIAHEITKCQYFNKKHTTAFKSMQQHLKFPHLISKRLRTLLVNQLITIRNENRTLLITLEKIQNLVDLGTAIQGESFFAKIAPQMKQVKHNATQLCQSLHSIQLPSTTSEPSPVFQWKHYMNAHNALTLVGITGDILSQYNLSWEDVILYGIQSPNDCNRLGIHSIEDLHKIASS